MLNVSLVKPELNPSFPHSEHFGMVNSYYLIPITLEVLLALFLPSSWSYCKRIVIVTGGPW